MDASISRLFHWAAYADKYGGTVQETGLYGATVKINEPVGPIGIACPNEYPLLGFVSLFAPAIVRGNTMIIVPSETAPLAALDLYQVFETSDLPAGVVNIVSGHKDHLTKYLSEHQDIEAMWYFGSDAGARFVEAHQHRACDSSRALASRGLSTRSSSGSGSGLIVRQSKKRVVLLCLNAYRGLWRAPCRT